MSTERRAWRSAAWGWTAAGLYAYTGAAAWTATHPGSPVVWVLLPVFLVNGWHAGVAWGRAW